MSLQEHVRSTDGPRAWQACHEMTMMHATAAERRELLAECGKPQRKKDKFGNFQRKFVVAAIHDGEAEVLLQAAPAKGGSQRFKPETDPPETSWEAGQTAEHDPTRIKPLLALLWLRLAVERMQKKGAIEPQQLLTVSQVINDLVGAYNSIDKVDKMVLPFPYAQLLKVLMLVYVFTLPFVIVEEVKLATPQP